MTSLAEPGHWCHDNHTRQRKQLENDLTCQQEEDEQMAAWESL